jgi:hypothetical protein
MLGETEADVSDLTFGKILEMDENHGQKGSRGRRREEGDDKSCLWKGLKQVKRCQITRRDHPGRYGFTAICHLVAI